MTGRINDYNSCVVCGRLPDGLGVGDPKRIGWYCENCGPETARKATDMAGSKTFKKLEQAAIKSVAALCGDGEIRMKPDEFEQFVAWAVENFGVEMRRIIGSGEPPF